MQTKTLIANDFFLFYKFFVLVLLFIFFFFFYYAILQFEVLYMVQNTSDNFLCKIRFFFVRFSSFYTLLFHFTSIRRLFQYNIYFSMTIIWYLQFEKHMLYVYRLLFSSLRFSTHFNIKICILYLFSFSFFQFLVVRCIFIYSSSGLTRLKSDVNFILCCDGLEDSAVVLIWSIFYLLFIFSSFLFCFPIFKYIHTYLCFFFVFVFFGLSRNKNYLNWA